MTATTSPPPTSRPRCADLGDRARLLGGHVVLHLHCLEDDDCVAGFDFITDGDIDLHDGALHRHGDVAAAGAASARPAATASSSGTASAGCRRCPSGFRTHMATLKRLPLTSTSSSRLILGSSSSARSALVADTSVRSRTSSTHFVECSLLRKSSCSRMAMSAGMVVATPSTRSSPSARRRG